MKELAEVWTLSLSFWCQSLPWLVGGILISSLILVYVPLDKLATLTRRYPVLGAMLGILLAMVCPVAQVGAFPIARRFLNQGVGLALAISFLVAAPVLNPWQGWAFLQQDFPLVNLGGLGIGTIALVISLIFAFDRTQKHLNPNALGLMEELTPENSLEVSHQLAGGTLLTRCELPAPPAPPATTGNLLYQVPETRSPIWMRQGQAVLENSLGEVVEWGFWLWVGCGAIALVQRFFPVMSLVDPAQNATAQGFSLVTLAIVLSVGDWYHSALLSPLFHGFNPGALWSLLTVGVVFNLKNLGLFFLVLRPLGVVFLWVLMVQLCLLGGFLIQLLLP